MHPDVKKPGCITGFYGHRITGDRRRGRGAGWDFVHAAIDDASRLGYAEVRPYRTSGLRARALPLYLSYCNRKRPHGSLDARPPISRLKAGCEQRL